MHKHTSPTIAAIALLILMFTPLRAFAVDAIDMQRLYNPNSGEHFYTASEKECDALVAVGWTYEGIGWCAPRQSNTPVYRLYSGTDHHYTTNANERDALKRVGWKYEGIGWYSDDDEGVPLYRQFNPYVDPTAKNNNSGSHNYTTSQEENDALVRMGWRAEGIGWYGVDEYGGDDDYGGDAITTDEIAKMREDGQIDAIYRKGGNIRAIIGTFTDQKVTDEESAADLLNRASDLYWGGIPVEPDDITVNSTPADTGLGAKTETYYRYTPCLDGVATLGSQIVLTTDDSGTVTGLFNTYDHLIDSIDMTFSIEAGDAEAIVVEDLSDELGTPIPRSSLSLSAEPFIDCHMDPAQLVWRVSVTNMVEVDGEIASLSMGLTGNRIIDRTYYIAANGQYDDAGTILRKVGNEQSAETFTVVRADDALGRTRLIEVLQEGNDRYLLEDQTRDIKTYTVGYNDSAPGDPVYPGDPVVFSNQLDATAVSVHANMEDVYEFYRRTLQRDSFDGDGAQIRISYNQHDLTNAFWWSKIQQFVFGDGGGFTKALDVMAHEFTHAVVSYIVGNGNDKTLIYEGESGALNESFADIMGCLAEYGAIEGKSSDGLWLIGEDSDNTIRSLSSPKDYSWSIDSGEKGVFPNHYSDRYTGANDSDHDNGGVHINSSIFNHAAYLMINSGRTRNSVSDWAKVFYRALYRLEEDADFKDARAAVIAAAKQCKFSKSELQAIADAFDAVGITGNALVYADLTWDSAPGSHSDIDLDAYFYEIDVDDTETVFHDADDVGGLGGHERATLIVDEPGTYYFCAHDSSNDYKRWTAEASIYDSTGQNQLAKCSTSETVRMGDPIPGEWWVVFKVKFDESLEPTVITTNRYTNNYPGDVGGWVF